jgi:hypothetical protein
MRKVIIFFGLVWVAMMLIPVIAQSSIPFQHWPALYDAANKLVVKRGIDQDGVSNNKMYFRIGWGPCLAVFRDEWSDLIWNAKDDRYINVRQFAEQRLAADQSNIGWGADDDYNCPMAPLEVKPYWRGSRPVYYRVLDEIQNKYVRGPKSPYRIKTDGALATCLRFGTVNSSGELTNYWLLDEGAEIYNNDIVMVVSELPEQLVTICREQDKSIEDYRTNG